MKNLITYAVSLIVILLLCNLKTAASTYDWTGAANDNSWTNKNNWKVSGSVPAAGPTLADDIQIGVNNTFTSAPTVSTTASCASVAFGTKLSSTLTVSGTLTVTGSIQQNPSSSFINVLGSSTITSTLAGTGTINCASIQVGDLTTTLSVIVLKSNTVQIASTVSNLNVTGGIASYSTTVFVFVIPLGFNNAAFLLNAGTATVGGQLLTATASSGLLPASPSFAAATIAVNTPAGSTANLKLTNVTPIDPASISGSIDFYNNTGGTGSTIEYASASAQTVYTNTATALDHSPSTYQNLAFSAAGKKNILSGNLLIAGNWSSNGGQVDAITNDPTVIFQGTTQTLTDAGSYSGAGVTFKNVTFQGGGTKTISSGAFSIYDIGIVTATASSTLNANGNLTLLSDQGGSASVAAIPLGSSIIGNVYAQRFVKGSSTDLSKRNYRLISSPVYTGTVSGKRVFDLNYLLASTYICGAAGGGFNSPNGTNPTLYLYREDVAPSSTTFTSGPWKGINKINNSPVYNIGTQSRTNKANVNDTTVNLYAGNGVLFYFIGNQSNNATQTGSKTTAPFDYPEDVVFSQPGALNTGTIDVQLWFKGNSLLSYTNNSLANSTIRGFNFVGNPYASTINWEKFNRASTLSASSIYSANMPAASTQQSKIWIFNPSTRQFDTYMQKSGSVSLADTTTTVNPSSMYTGAASNMIASGQGFFVQATAANQTLSFRETAKTTTQPTSSNLIQLMTMPKSFAATVTETQPAEPVLRFKMRMDSINTDDVVIGFSGKSSNTFVNEEDAEDMGGNGALVSLSLISADSVNLAISRQPLPATQTVTSLFVSSKTSGLYTFELTKEVDLPSVYQVWLMDAFKKDSLDMHANKVYSFTIDKNDPNTFGNKRFSLVIRTNPQLGIHLLNFTAKKENTKVNTAWKVENEFNYTSFDLERSTDGGTHFDTQYSVASSALGDYTYTDAAPSNGQNMYRLKIYTIDGHVTYSKAITIDFADFNNLANNLNVFPNPTTNSVNFMMPPDETGKTPTYRVQILNIAGSVVESIDSTNAHWKKDVSDYNPGTYIIQVTNTKDQSVWGMSKFVKN
jgi:hypothetical protein